MKQPKSGAKVALAATGLTALLGCGRADYNASQRAATPKETPQVVSYHPSAYMLKEDGSEICVTTSPALQVPVSGAQCFSYEGRSTDKMSLQFSDKNADGILDFVFFLGSGNVKKPMVAYGTKDGKFEKPIDPFLPFLP